MPKREADSGVCCRSGNFFKLSSWPDFGSRFRPTNERVTTPVLGLGVDLGFNSSVISGVVLVNVTSARLCLRDVCKKE